MTASTAAFLHTASTLTDPITSAICAISPAYGPLHGGAIDIAYRTIREVGSVENVGKSMKEVKGKKRRLYGYGHRVYKVPDPRLGVIQGILRGMRSCRWRWRLIAKQAGRSIL